LKENKKLQNIHVDWDKYVDEDDEAEEGQKGLGGGQWDPSAMQGSKFPLSKALEDPADSEDQAALVDLEASVDPEALTLETMRMMKTTREESMISKARRRSKKINLTSTVPTASTITKERLRSPRSDICRSNS
jgi:hypothetical protein